MGFRRLLPLALLAPVLVLLSGLQSVAIVARAQDQIVYVTQTGTKYHLETCRSLAKSKIPMKLAEAAAKYGPCSICHPPVPAASVAPPKVVQARAAPSQTRSEDQIVYVTKTGTKYHRETCRSLARSKIAMKLADAAKKYGACGVCKPPVLPRK